MQDSIDIRLGTLNSQPFTATLTDETPHAQIYGYEWERFIIQMMDNIMEDYTPSEVEMITTGEFTNGLLMSTDNYLDYMHTVSWDSSTSYLTAELERRLGLFEHNNARNLREYADRVEELPKLLVFVDDWTDDMKIVHDLGKTLGLHFIFVPHTFIPEDVFEFAFAVDVESYNKATVKYDGTTSLIQWS